MPQYYRILDNGMPKPKSKKRSKTGVNVWDDESAARNMIQKYSGNSSDMKNARNALSKKGINNVFDQLHYMAKFDEATRTAGGKNPYAKNKKKNVKKGVK